jgi:predicted transcriptional regulator
MDDLANKLKELVEAQKAFKKEYKDVFKKNTEFNKEVRAAKDALVAKMKADSVTSYEYDGMEFNLKETTTEKHNSELINELLGDTSKFEDYMSQVRGDKADVSTRKAKRQKAGD